MNVFVNAYERYWGRSLSCYYLGASLIEILGKPLLTSGILGVGQSPACNNYDECAAKWGALYCGAP